MKFIAVFFLIGSQLVLGGCATTSNEFARSAAPAQSLQPSQVTAGNDNSSGNSDAGLTVRDTVETVQDVTQTAREAKSTVYEVKRTINELKGLMQGW
jgi:hypothetical protein